MCEQVLFASIFGGALYLWLAERRNKKNAFDHADVMNRIDKKIDEPLRERLDKEDIKLLKCEWLASRAADEALHVPAAEWRLWFPHMLLSNGVVRMRHRQYLEEHCPEAFLSRDEALALFDRGDRSVLALSYRWLTGDHPDPFGTTLAEVRAKIKSDDSLLACGLFWECVRLSSPHRTVITHLPLV